MIYQEKLFDCVDVFTLDVRVDSRGGIEMHDSWKSMKVDGWLQNNKFCPLCGKEHVLFVYNNKTYCTENHIKDSGWSNSMYDALITDPRAALNLIVGNGRDAQEERRKVDAVLARLDQKRTMTLHEKMTVSSVDAAQKLAEQMLVKMLEKERQKLEEEYQAKNKHADQHYSNYWNNYWNNYWQQQLMNSRAEKRRDLQRERRNITLAIEDAIY